MTLRSPTARRVATVAFVVYLVALAAAAFLPLPDVRSLAGSRSEVRVNLVLSRPDLLRSWEAERNVLMTIPFGLLLPLVVRWRYELLVAACLGVTLVVETGQLLGSLAAGWAWRAFDVDDILLNTVGGLIGLGVTGAALAVSGWRARGGGAGVARPGVAQPGVARPGRLPAYRYVAGVAGAAVVGWAVLATATTPSYEPPVYACDRPPSGAVTSLPGGASAYAGGDGSLCLRTPDGGAMSLPHDVGAAPVATFETAEGTYELGVTVTGSEQSTDDARRPVHALAVEGSDLLVWATLLS